MKSEFPNIGSVFQGENVECDFLDDFVDPMDFCNALGFNGYNSEERMNIGKPNMDVHIMCFDDDFLMATT